VVEVEKELLIQIMPKQTPKQTIIMSIDKEAIADKGRSD
jgi:hypothetical protein